MRFKIYNASAQPVFCSLTVKFDHVSADVVVCFNPLIKVSSRLRGCPSGKMSYARQFQWSPNSYISEESFMNFTIKIQYKRASFRKYQEPVSCEMTECSSTEFIGYRILSHEQNGCKVLYTKASISKSVSGVFDLSRYSDWLSRYLQLKLE